MGIRWNAHSIGISAHKKNYSELWAVKRSSVAIAVVNFCSHTDQGR